MAWRSTPKFGPIAAKRHAKNTQVAMQDEDIDEALVREREAELRNINADVHKVNEIFRDLATLVDKQQDAKVLEDPDLYEQLDDKNYNFELPMEIDEYDDLREEEPTDK